MNEKTLKKLRENPFYKLSVKQRMETVVVREQISPLGDDVRVHDNTIQKAKGKITRGIKNG